MPGNDKKRVDEHDVHEMVEPASAIAGERADRETHQPRAEHDANANQHRDAGAVDDARKNVAAKFVGAHRVPGSWARQTGGQILHGGIRGRDPRRGDRENYEEQRESQSLRGPVALWRRNSRRPLIGGAPADQPARTTSVGEQIHET